MNDLNIQGTASTPMITTNTTAGLLRMAGDSYPENSFEFFGEVIAWVERQLEADAPPLHLELRLVYLNTSSVKAMLDIFDMLQAAHERGRAVAVDWYYDPLNERVEELAHEFREDYAFPFRINAEAGS